MNPHGNKISFSFSYWLSSLILAQRSHKFQDDPCCKKHPDSAKYLIKAARQSSESPKRVHNSRYDDC
jgi:hypothetical protein